MKNSYYILLLAAILASCAQVVTPSGGPKDITPPRIVRMSPDNFSTGFKGRNVYVTFDEFVVLKDAQTEVVISPPLEKKPLMKLKGTDLHIQFVEDLKENTTYTINLGNAIRDLNENNALDSNLIVFSTGDYLDSLSLRGRVVHASDLKPAEGVLVMLYPQTGDSIPYKVRPNYFARTGKSGSFTISNIRDTIYKVFALKDENSNYLYDQPNELIAYSDSLIKPDTGLASIELKLFQEIEKKIFVKSHRYDPPGKMTFIFNRPVKDPDITSINSEFKKSWKINEQMTNRDTLIVWLADIGELDSLQVGIQADGRMIDTIKVDKPTVKDTGKLGLSTNLTLPFDLNKDLLIKTAHPVKTYDLDKIILMEDSGKVDFKVQFDDPALRKLFIQYPWKENSMYELYVPPTAFKDIYGWENDTFKLKFPVREKAYYGDVTLKVNPGNGSSDQYILQVLTDKGNVVRETNFSGDTVLTYNYLHPKSYNIKLILDSNGNGVWDSGDYLKNRQPEKVYFHATPVEVRSNWEIEVEWEFGVNSPKTTGLK